MKSLEIQNQLTEEWVHSTNEITSKIEELKNKLKLRTNKHLELCDKTETIFEALEAVNLEVKKFKRYHKEEADTITVKVTITASATEGYTDTGLDDNQIKEKVFELERALEAATNLRTEVNPFSMGYKSRSGSLSGESILIEMWV